MMEDIKGEIAIYNPDDSIRLDVLLDGETVWLTIKQLSQLFNRDRTVISRHIKNIFAEGELDPLLVCAKNAHTKKYGRRDGYKQNIEIDFYNLDVIISVGYRVKSILQLFRDKKRVLPTAPYIFAPGKRGGFLP